MAGLKLFNMNTDLESNGLRDIWKMTNYRSLKMLQHIKNVTNDLRTKKKNSFQPLQP